ncbi:MAG: hypothetical protein MUP17_09545 [candidate division Zixibacteria bacterium]|nr:hypothetical protein [candidate division Zixibacteria bacterium]
MTYPLKTDTGNPRAKCEYCGKDFEQTRPDKKFCSPEHQDAAQSIRKEKSRNRPGYHKQYNEIGRIKAFLILGNQCQDCGEKDPMVLCIDHIEPVGKKRKKTTSIYWEITENPEESKEKYQLLCRNCNWRKMIQNNERKPGQEQFAFRWEIEALTERVLWLERKLPKIRAVQCARANKNPINKKPEQYKLTEEQIEKILMPRVQQLVNEKTGKLDVAKLRMFLRLQGIIICSWKAYQIKGNIEAANPQLFEES